MYGGMNKIVASDGGTAAIAIAGEVTVYTHSFKMALSDAFGLFLKAAGTTVNLKVEFEAGKVRPTTEGSEDTANYVEPDGMPDVAVINDTNLHAKQHSPIPTPFGRFKITGLSGNTADVTLNLDMFTQGGF